MRYKINGVTMPAPTECEPELNNLYGSNTGRDERGVNHLDLVRSGVRKWKIKHVNLSRGEAETILKALNPRGFQFTAMQVVGGVVTANCYATIQEQKCIYYQNDGPTGSRWNISFDVIEN